MGTARALGKISSGIPDLSAATPRSSPATVERGLARVDGHLAGATQVPAHEWERPKLLLGQNAELEWQLGEEHRRIHVAEVVGGVNRYGRIL